MVMIFRGGYYQESTDDVALSYSVDSGSRVQRC